MDKLFQPIALASALAVPLLGGCGGDAAAVVYTCDEPLSKYLELARENIANDYEVARSGEVLDRCPDKDFHRRYSFAFNQAAVVSKQTAAASIRAEWCNDAVVKTVAAELETSTSMLIFRFNYPWSTSTGKYPRTEFRLNRNTLKGGFFEDLNWQCRLIPNEQGADDA